MNKDKECRPTKLIKNRHFAGKIRSSFCNFIEFIDERISSFFFNKSDNQLFSYKTKQWNAFCVRNSLKSLIHNIIREFKCSFLNWNLYGWSMSIADLIENF